MRQELVDKRPIALPGDRSGALPLAPGRFVNTHSVRCLFDRQPFVLQFVDPRRVAERIRAFGQCGASSSSRGAGASLLERSDTAAAAALALAAATALTVTA
jgi:hypothetical protein